MTEPMKTLRTTRNAVNFLNETGYADQALFNIKEPPIKLSELLERFSHQEKSAERERIKSYLKSELNETYDGYRHSTLSKVFELIDSL